MDVNAVSINQVFLNTRILKIPFFQRGYVWEESNWKQFFDDLTTIASMDEEEKPEDYFMGSIILKNASENGMQQFDVIDGQQRLTTIVIFMKALCLALDRNDLFNNGFMQLSLSGERKPILVPNYNDKIVFNQIVNADFLSRKPIVDNSRLANAFAYFTNRILDAKEPVDGSTPISPVRLFNTIMNHVKLVSIEVQNRENAQKIFETINCTGIKLTTGEMLKNYLFDESKVEEYERSWKKVFENGNRQYWEGEIVNGRIQGSHIENFFYRYMLIKMQEPEIKSGLSSNEVKMYRQKGGLFEKFRNMMEKFKISKESAIQEIVAYAKLYLDTFKAHTLESAILTYPGIERLAYLMYMQDAWTMTPYILYILTTVKDQTERNKIFAYMENYLMRRIICKCKNNSYSDLFSENLIGQGVNTFEAFKAYVNDKDARGTLLMPSNEEVYSAVEENDLKSSAQTILYMLESKLNPDFEESEHDNSFCVFKKDQIMPEKDTTGKWPTGASYTNEERLAKTKTLGNFTLLRGNLKSKDKSADWSVKRKALQPLVADLSLSQFAQNGLQMWNEDTISERNHWLAERILETWPM